MASLSSRSGLSSSPPPATTPERPSFGTPQRRPIRILVPESSHTFASHIHPKNSHHKSPRHPQEPSSSIKRNPSYHGYRHQDQNHHPPPNQHPFQHQNLLSNTSPPPTLPSLSPGDPGYLETLDSYFSQGHLGQTPSMDSQPQYDPTSDEEKDAHARKAARNERHRSRSICGPVSPLQTPSSSPRSFSTVGPPSGFATPMSRQSSTFIPPAIDGTITTPPPFASAPYTPRRRHHSCVSPNTPEFTTLSTIYGWVTSSTLGESSIPLASQGKIESKHLHDLGLIRSARNQSAEDSDDDDSDLDDCLRYSIPMEWSTSLESSSGSAFAESCVQSPVHDTRYSSTSIEFLTDIGEMDLASLSGHRSNSESTSPEPQRRNSGNTLLRSSSAQPMMRAAQEFSIPQHKTNSRQRSSSVNLLSVVQPSNVSTQGLTPCVEGERRGPSSGRLRQLSAERLSHIETTQRNNGISLPNSESPSTDISEATLFSPLSGGQGKESVYIPLSCQRQSQHIVPPPVEEKALEGGAGLGTRTGKQLGTNNVFNPQSPEHENMNLSTTPRTSKEVKHDSEATIAPASPPEIPPRYPDINTSAFDNELNDDPRSIVFASTTPSKRDSLSDAFELKPILAVTIVKLIEKLTHDYGMDSGFIKDFFLTYRLFMSPVQLCRYLIQRYLWALQQDTEARCVVRVRTFVVLRHWINTHFEDDFLTSKSLRYQMGKFLNAMRDNRKVQGSARDARIIRSLMEFFKYQRRYYKTLAQQNLIAGDIQDFVQDPVLKEVIPESSSKALDNADEKSVEVNELGISSPPKALQPKLAMVTLSDVSKSPPSARPIRLRNRASTLAGATARSMAGEALKYHYHTKAPHSKDSKPSYMSRQVSEGGVYPVRERRLSGSSAKSNKSATSWSAKMTLSISKLRQRSEDIYQQFVHPSSPQQRHEFKSCVCWTPAYTGVTEHPTLNAARSFPSLRQSVAVSQAAQGSLPKSASGLPSNKSIKRLKSSLNLGLSGATATIPSPVPSPTRNQFSTISSRHSRSNSNSSMGYHPNPDCPYHMSCLASATKDESISAVPGQSVVESRQPSSEPLHPVPPLPSSSMPPTSVGAASLWSPPATTSSPIVIAPPYKPFILFHRSQMIAQQLCLLDQSYLEKIKWDELLGKELSKAGRTERSKARSSISGFFLDDNREENGVKSFDERRELLSLWVASEVVSTHPIEDRVRVIEKLIRIAQKCYQYRNFNSLVHIVLGLGSGHLCGLRRTWARVGGYEMRVLQDLQALINPTKNWQILRRMMMQVGYQDALDGDHGQRFGFGQAPNISQRHSDSALGSDSVGESDLEGYSSHLFKYLQHEAPLEKQACIPFMTLFITDLEHIAASSPWYLPPAPVDQSGLGTENELNGGCGAGERGQLAMPTPPTSNCPDVPVRLTPPDTKELRDLLPTGALLLNFHRFRLIAKTIKWFMAFQKRSQKYTFPIESTLYSKCLLLRVLSQERIRELADHCESE